MWPRTGRRLRLRLAPVVTAAVLGAIIVAAVAVWVTVSLGAWHTEAAEAADATAKTAAYWQAALETQLVWSATATQCLATFVVGAATALPNHTGTVAERMAQPLKPAAFEMMAAELWQSNPAVHSLQIQSSSIVTQVYPASTAPIGLDVYNIPEERADVLAAIETAQTVVSGPERLIEGRMTIVVRTPVFLSVPRNFSSWWGMAAAVILLDSCVNNTGIQRLCDEGYFYALEYTDTFTHTVEVISNNTPLLDHSKAVHLEVQLPNGLHLDLYVAAQRPPAQDSTTELVYVGGVAVAIAAAMVAVFLAVRWCRYRWPRDVFAAPKGPPLVLLFTDIESSTALWLTAPEAMAAALRLHNAIIRKVIKRLGAYECKTIGDSFMIACGTVQAGLDVALELQRALRASRDWPPEVGDFYDVPWMKVRVGAHYCTDVQCTFDDVTQRYDYFGKDVNKAARVASKALGGEILLSEELQAEAAKGPSYTISSFGSFKLRGINGLQQLYRLHLTPQATVLSAASLHRRQQAAGGPLVPSPPEDASHAVARAVVSEWLHFSTADCDEPQLLQLVLLCADVLTISLGPVVGPKKRDVLEALCGAWGIAAHSGRGLHQLSLRLALQLQPKRPTLFSPSLGLPHPTAMEPCDSPSMPPSTWRLGAFLDPSMDHSRQEGPPMGDLSSLHSCVVQQYCEDDFDAIAPPHALNRPTPR